MRVKDSQLWISKTLEGSYNTPEATGSNYSMVPTANPNFLLPVVEKVNDANRQGRNAPSHLCNTYWSHPEIALQDDLETDVPARLFRRGLGGSVVTTEVDDGVYDHEFAMLNPQIGVNLPSFSAVSLLGAASFLWSGLRVDRFRASQQNAERVQYESTLVGSGKHATPHGRTGLPALISPVCMDGFRTQVTYVDPDSNPVDFGALGTLIEWFVELQNALRRNKRRIGDPVLTIGDGAAAHVRNMPIGQERTTQIGLKTDFVDLTQWQESVANAKCTDLKFTSIGPLIDTTYRHEFEIIVPEFSFEVITPDEDEGDAATSINVIAFEDSVSKGTITGRIRNDQATLV